MGTPLKFKKSENLSTVLIRTFSYPTPSNLNYFWNFGSLAFICLMVQILTGLLLTIWYIPSTEQAFVSVEYVMGDVFNGNYTRYVHANGASLFFIIIYLHMLRGLYHSSYTEPREKVWYTGAIIYFLLMGTAFFGYILPWGQMSYWAATVITNLLTALPLIGEKLLLYSWGGLIIGQPLLNRVYTLHFILPFIILLLVFFHIYFLHNVGSSNPIGIKEFDKVNFHPFFVFKDILGFIVVYLFFFSVVSFFSNVLLHPDNNIPANPDVTPLHIVPEWYFLLFYGILRSIPNKRLGILAIILALGLIFFLPKISKPIITSSQYRPIFRQIFWFFLVDMILLSWTATNSVESPYYIIGQVTTIIFFLFFLIINPIIIYIEKLTYLGLKFMIKKYYLRKKKKVLLIKARLIAWVERLICECEENLGLIRYLTNRRMMLLSKDLIRVYSWLLKRFFFPLLRQIKRRNKKK